ncbi:MAG: hypothetical protein ACYC69_17265 [Thermodesulfovibrionales bacterium]
MKRDKTQKGKYCHPNHVRCGLLRASGTRLLVCIPLLLLAVVLSPTPSFAGSTGTIPGPKQLSSPAGPPSLNLSTGRILKLSPEGLQRQRVRFPIDTNKETAGELYGKVHSLAGMVLSWLNRLNSALVACKIAHNSLTGAIDNCSQKNYSTSDQMTAQCQPTDTISQCEEKMLKVCAAGARHNVIDRCSNAEMNAGILKNYLEDLNAIMPRIDKFLDQGPQIFAY